MSGYSIAVTGNVPVNVPINFVTNSGTAVSASNNINILGAGGTTTSGAGNTVTITTVSGQLNWTDESSDFTAVANEGYFCTAALTLSLPSGASQGNMISIIVDTTDPVTVQAPTGQFIAIGAETSSISGSAVSTARGDNLILVYRSSTLTWWALEADATWTLV